MVKRLVQTFDHICKFLPFVKKKFLGGTTNDGLPICRERKKEADAQSVLDSFYQQDHLSKPCGETACPN